MRVCVLCVCEFASAKSICNASHLIHSIHSHFIIFAQVDFCKRFTFWSLIITQSSVNTHLFGLHRQLSFFSNVKNKWAGGGGGGAVSERALKMGFSEPSLHRVAWFEFVTHNKAQFFPCFLFGL